MTQIKREKSKKYPGVYFRQVERADGLGLERMYYILYRRGGRGSKQIEEPLGKSSQGWTEALANRERAERIGGKESNREKRKEAEKEKLLAGHELTYDRLFELYIEANEGKPCIKNDIGLHKNHIQKRLGSKNPAEIITADIEALRRGVEKLGRAPQTVKHAIALVRRVLRYGQKLGFFIMPGNLVFEMPRVDNQKTEFMTDQQMAAYMAALDAEPDQDATALPRLALHTGIRRGALLALRWEDCDFERGIITLRGITAKNRKTDIVPMNDAVRDILMSITRKNEYVFPGKNGGHRKEIKRITQRVRNKAGLPKDFRPLHGLRHNFASQLASSGKVDIYTLKDLLTHESIAMTQRYAHLADEAKRRAANVAAEIFQGKPKIQDDEIQEGTK